MEDMERKFDRVQMPDSSVPSHREELRKRLQFNRIPLNHTGRTMATLGLMAVVIFGGLTLGYPSWAKDLWKTPLVQTITLRTKGGQKLIIKKVECKEGECQMICDTSTCDSSWITPDGRKYFRKRVRSGSSVDGPIRITMTCIDSSRLTDLLRKGIEFTPPSSATISLSNPDGKEIWVVNGDTVNARDITMETGDLSKAIGDFDDDPVEPRRGKDPSSAEVNPGIEQLRNDPNPFNPTTQISFSLKQSGNVTLKVYNMMGQEVASLVDGYTQAGQHTVQFDGSRLTSGAYVYTLSAAGFQVSKTMVLAK